MKSRDEIREEGRRRLARLHSHDAARRALAHRYPEEYEQLRAEAEVAALRLLGVTP